MPEATIARHIGRVGALGNDALQAALASEFVERRGRDFAVRNSEPDWPFNVG